MASICLSILGNQSISRPVGEPVDLEARSQLDGCTLLGGLDLFEVLGHLLGGDSVLDIGAREDKVSGEADLVDAPPLCRPAVLLDCGEGSVGAVALVNVEVLFDPCPFEGCCHWSVQGNTSLSIFEEIDHDLLKSPKKLGY
jgi:hypothetical protein